MLANCYTKDGRWFLTAVEEDSARLSKYEWDFYLELSEGKPPTAVVIETRW